MEVVAAVSSVAGIASLVGQSLRGLNHLYNLFKDCREASKTAESFLNEVTKLKDTLGEVQKLVDNLQHVCSGPASSTLASLTIHLEDCGKDVARWLIAAQKASKSESSTAKKAFKRFLLGIKIKSIKDVFQEISRHRHSLALILSATGRALDIQTIQNSESLSTKIEEVASYSKITVEALSRLEDCFAKAPQHNDSSRRSTRSLGDIASQLSRIESLLSFSYSPTSSHASPSGYSLPDNNDGKYAGIPRGAVHMSNEDPPNHKSNASTIYDFLTGYSNPHSSAHARKFAGFVGHGQMESIRQFRCLCCCGHEQMTFQSMNALKQHERERPFGCLYCTQKFSSKEKIELHMFEHHYKFASWSCINLVDWQAAYYASSDQCKDRCGYCGQDFLRSGPLVPTNEDSITRERHLLQHHMYKECDITGMEKHFSPYEFRDHLRISHGATMGLWMDFLLDACMRDESTQINKIKLADFELSSDMEVEVSREIFRALGGRGEMTHWLVPKYGSLLAGFNGEECPQALVDYLIATNRVEKLNSDQHLVLALTGHVDRSKCPFAYQELLLASKRIVNHLGLLEKLLMKSKQACWNLGFDLSSFDHTLTLSNTIGMHFKKSDLSRGEQEQCEDLLSSWHDILHERAVRTWGTSNNRINSWLLQNLAASPEEQKLHRSYLYEGRDLDENTWARLVLKYWLIDEAAIGSEEENCSTNGAVNSSRICHSTRVILNNLPARKRKTIDDSSLPEGVVMKKPRTNGLRASEPGHLFASMSELIAVYRKVLRCFEGL